MARKLNRLLILITSVTLSASQARAEGPAPVVTEPGPAPTAAPPAVPPAPYSLPWQLRPTAAANVVRSDTSVAMYEGGGNSGSTVASTLLVSYKISSTLAPLIRVGMVTNNDPGPKLESGSAFLNPILGLTWAPKIAQDWRMSVTGAAAVPVGTGGDKPAAMDAAAAAVAKGIVARSSMDNAMFAVNYFVMMGGVDLAYVAHKVTVQAEATVLQLTRVRHETISPESARTNMTLGLHLGYMATSWLSLGSELRYQRWLSTPNAVKANPALREMVTVAVGPRFHFKLSDKTWLRPGISYSRGLDDPLSAAKYNIVQVDLPFAF